jgi:hypothetical protein
LSELSDLCCDSVRTGALTLIVNVVHGQAPATVRAHVFPDDLVADLAASLAAAPTRVYRPKPGRHRAFVFRQPSRKRLGAFATSRDILARRGTCRGVEG